jgi:hypothetical protein
LSFGDPAGDNPVRGRGRRSFDPGRTPPGFHRRGFVLSGNEEEKQPQETDPGQGKKQNETELFSFRGKDAFPSLADHDLRG